MKSKHPAQLSLKITLKDGKVLFIKTSKKRRFLAKVQAVSKLGVAKYALSVSYGTYVNIQGKKITAKNEGVYTTLNEFLFAFYIFTDPKEADFIRTT